MEKTGNDKRWEILNAAIALFSERGFERTTVDEIATRANVGKGTIYLHFENKEKIFIAIIDSGMQHIIDRMSEVLNESGDFIQEFERLLLQHLQFAEKHCEFYKVFLKERLNMKLIGDKDAQDRLIEMHHKAEQMLTRFFQIGIDQKRVRKGDPNIYSYVFSGILSHFTYHWLIEKNDESLVDKAPVIMDLFFNGVGEKCS